MLELAIQILTSFAAGFLILTYLFTSSVKITRWHKYLAEFQLGFMKKYGLNSKVYSLIGIAELAAALGLLLQGNHVLGTLAAGGLFILCIAAFIYHLKFDSFQFGMPALISAILSGIVFLANHRFLDGLPENLSLNPNTFTINFSFTAVIPFLLGLVLAFSFAKVMLAAASERLKNAHNADPYEV